MTQGEEHQYIITISVLSWKGMKKLFWLGVCLLLELCYAKYNSGCCGKNNSDGICSNCCSNFYLSEGECKECPLGYHGMNCSISCVYPYYGLQCASTCSDYPNNCSEADCNITHGCQSNGLESSTNKNLEVTTGTTDRKDVGKTLSTTKHEDQSTTTDSEKEFDSKDPPWLVSILKLLGYTLCISLLVILGLVCLFLCKRRQELNSLNSSQPAGQEFRLLNHISERNVDRVTASGNIISRNNINSSAVSQGRGFIGKYRNNYGKPLTCETGTHCHAEIPDYVEVLP